MSKKSNRSANRAGKRSTRSQAQQVGQSNQSSSSSSSSSGVAIDTQPSPTVEPHHHDPNAAPVGEPTRTVIGSAAPLEQSVPTSQDPPTPTALSTIPEVKAWLGWFATCHLGLTDNELQQLCNAFRGSGTVILGYSKEDCRHRSSEWGDAIYNALHQSPVTPLVRTADDNEEKAQKREEQLLQEARAREEQLLQEARAREELQQALSHTQQLVDQLRQEARAREAELRAQIERLSTLAIDSSWNRRTATELGSMLYEVRTGFDISEHIGQPQHLESHRSCTKESEVQAVWNNIMSGCFTKDQELSWQDRSQHEVGDGHKPDIVIGFYPKPIAGAPPPAISFASCVSVIELKTSFSPNAFYEALGQAIQRFAAIRLVQPQRKFMVALLGDQSHFYVAKLIRLDNMASVNRAYDLQLSPRYPIHQVPDLIRILYDPKNARDMCGYLPADELLEKNLEWTAGEGGVFGRTRNRTTSELTSLPYCCRNFEIAAQQEPQKLDACQVYRAKVYQGEALTHLVIVKVSPTERAMAEITAIQAIQKQRDSNSGLLLPPVKLMHHTTNLQAAVALVLLPQGISSLHHPHLQDDSTLADNILRWLRQVDHQLAAMHTIELCHGDVKPSNMVYYRKKGVLHATLIDFEHCVALASNSHKAFSGTVRYASRRIFSIVRGCTRGHPVPNEYWYSPFDDFESLFYSAFEILHDTQELPWRRTSNAVEALNARDALFNDGELWNSYSSHFAHVPGAWELMCQARIQLISYTNLSQLWPSNYDETEATMAS